MLACEGLEVRLWARTEREATELRNGGPNPTLLPGITFPPQLSITSSLSGALAEVKAVILAVPSQSMRQNIKLVKDYLKEITDSMTGVAEGVTTTIAAWNLAQQFGLEMPITEKIYQVLYEGLDPRQVIIEILGTEGRHELAGRKWKLVSFFRHRRHS